MENKVHFKLHKVKKQWVTIAVSGLALCASLIGVGVSADEQATNQITSASTPESVSQDPDLVITETSVATSKADQVEPNKVTSTTTTVTADKQPVLKEDQASSTYNLASGETRTVSSTSEVASTATDVNNQALESVETTVVSGGQFKSDAEGNWYYLKDGKTLTGAQNVDHFDLYFHEDGRQAKNEIVTINDDSYYFDKDNGRRVTGRRALDYANHKYFGFYYFDKDGKMFKDDFVTENGNLYYFDATAYQPNFVFVSDKAGLGIT
mgnify:FL=1